jgi:hypothetical protein
MRDLPIRKIPGIGRVSERLLDSIGVKVRYASHYRIFVIRSSCPFGAFSDMRRHLQMPWGVIVTGQTIWLALNAPNTLGHRILRRPAVGAGRKEKHWIREVSGH